MAHDAKRLQQILVDAAPPDLELAFRPMFGGILAYFEGRAFASLSNVGLALKAPAPLFGEFLETPGATALRYEPDGPPSKSYVLVPEAMLANRDLLRDWIARAARARKSGPSARRR